MAGRKRRELSCVACDSGYHIRGVPFLESAFLEPGRAAGESLQDLGARAVTDGEAYVMLYSVGAAFWWEFGALLEERGRDLLDVLFRHPKPRTLLCVERRGDSNTRCPSS